MSKKKETLLATKPPMFFSYHTLTSHIKDQNLKKTKWHEKYFNFQQKLCYFQKSKGHFFVAVHLCFLLKTQMKTKVMNNFFLSIYAEFMRHVSFFMHFENWKNSQTKEKKWKYQWTIIIKNTTHSIFLFKYHND